MAPFEVVPLDAGRLGDFARLHGGCDGSGWCYCAAWWVDTWDGWGDRSAGDNRAVRDALSARGERDGLLAYEGAAESGAAPVGWCQLGPRDRLAKLVRQFALEPDPAAWALTCFLVAPERRRAGVAGALLEAAVERARAAGATRLEAFPKRGPGLDDGDLWNGPEALFRAHGFAVVRDDPARPVLARRL